ncbi:LON peptidase substrate-binding domain-containing protein, partial [Thiolapillus sp.]
MTEESQLLARADEVLPNIIHLLPIAARPFFPGQGVPLLMDARHWAPTLKAIRESNSDLIGLVLTADDEAEKTTTKAMYRVGTVGRIHKVHEVDGQLQVLVECLQRFRIEKYISANSPYIARVDYLREPSGKLTKDIKA